ncbi:hypothetical protein TTRE_0000728601 [Trichuris trichiura]|uniref:Helix-turn-helix domain-containing protein n=1 Tax=Trichuris trichiura TaxID=36087 RepID=A0A077ZEY3_TRITR|nr:hypothetical protein TTRE_0000728601 [Trichuris trichiura]
MSVKRGTVTGMVDRAIAICDPEFLNSELHRIATTLEKNGYPKTFVSSTIARRLNPADSSSTTERDRLPVLTIPYYVGLGEHLQRMGRQYGFRIFFKSSPNFRSFVRNDKIKVPFEQRPGVVYVINCDCNASYIGETGNTLFDRFKEHMNALKSYRSAEDELNGIHRIRRGRPRTVPPLQAMEKAKNTSAVAEHSSQCSRDLHPSIICRESHFRLGQIKESLFIHNNMSINRDKGVEFSSIWTSVISKTGCCSIPTGAPSVPINTLTSE